MFPESHGGPIHEGSPEELGIKDVQKPNFGDPVTVLEHEVPIFWPCGVTTQAAVEKAELKEWISHAPGHMLVTDLLPQRLRHHFTSEARIL